MKKQQAFIKKILKRSLETAVSQTTVQSIFQKINRNKTVFLGYHGVAKDTEKYQAWTLVKEGDQLLVGEALKLVYVHHQRLPIGLPYLLGQPSKGLYARVVGREDVRAADGRDRPDALELSPDRHARAGDRVPGHCA